MTFNENFITIKEPCHEGWENMSISEKGRFCASCKKHVHDFTNATVDEIKLVYQQNNGNVCGHIPVKIIQEQYVQSQTRKGYFSYLKTFCIAAIFCFGANLFTIDAARATTLKAIKNYFFNTVSAPNKDTVTVTGILKDKDSRAVIPFATISVLYNDSSVVQEITNVNGEYLLKIPQSQYPKIDIKASYIGYMSHVVKNIVLDPNKQIVVDIDLQLLELMMDGMMVMEPLPVKTKHAHKKEKKKESK